MTPKFRFGMAALLVAFALAGSAFGQEIDPRDIKLGAARPFAILRVTGAFGSPNEILGFYVHWDKPAGAADRKRGFAIRRHDRSGGAEPIVAWAMSRTCPALEPLLMELESVPAPAIDVPTIGRDYGTPQMVADGTSYSLWSRSARWDGDATNAYAVRFSSNVHTPLADWADALQKGLADCWRSTEPAAPA